MKGKWIEYSSAELALIKLNRELPTKEQYRLFQDKFGRSNVSASNFNALRKRNGWLTGRSGRFEKGHDGYKGGPGGPNKTSFQKGGVPPNRKPLYTERISKDGYIEIKVPEKNPHTGAPTRYRHKHRWEWEQRHGPIKKGYILHFIDGDKTNCDPVNLELISRGVNAIMNKKRYSSLPEEIKPSVKTLAKLQHRLHELTL